MTEALVIDDNRNTADALVGMLEMLGIGARPAYGSSAAMTLLQTSVPSLILLDVNMPGVDGIEVLGFLKREPRLNSVPVIVITSDDQPETKERVMANGARAVILKPASLMELEPILKDIGAL
jgi:CheY-like chemotaxis protein